VRNGDRIRIDAPGRSVELLVGKAELKRRLKAVPPFEPRVKRGWLARYARFVTSADRGAILEV